MADIQIKGRAIANGVITGDHIAADAAIEESKINLSYATHSNENDPTSDEKDALAGVGSQPSAENPFATKSYVDEVVVGLAWEEPARVLKMVSDALNTPPENPGIGDAYVVGANPTGDWVGYPGYVMEWTGSYWMPNVAEVSYGHRFVVGGSVSPGGSFTGHNGDVAVRGESGYTFEAPENGSAICITDGVYANCQYVYQEDGDCWIQIGGLQSVTAGAGLTKDGNQLDVVAGDDSILVGMDSLAVQIANDSLTVVEEAGLAVKLADDSLTVVAPDGLAVQIADDSLTVVEEGGLAVKVDGEAGAMQVESSGLRVKVENIGGLQIGSGGLSMKRIEDGALVLTEDGLGVGVGSGLQVVEGGECGVIALELNESETRLSIDGGGLALTLEELLEELIVTEAGTTWDLADVPGLLLNVFIDGTRQRKVAANPGAGEFTLGDPDGKRITFGAQFQVGEHLLAQSLK